MKNLTLGILFCSLLALAACGSDGGSTAAEQTIPAAPANLTVMAGRGHLNETTPGNYVVIRWDAVPGATSYTLYHAATSNVTTSSYSVTGVTSPYAFPTPADFNHYFAITASNSAGESALSPVKCMAVLIPQTGQTASYGTGDDGALKKGVAWTADRFVFSGVDIVTDTLTGLMWRLDIVNSPVDWNSARISAMQTYSSYSDWRLPNRNELMSIMDYASSGIDSIWTSTANAQDLSQVWSVNKDSGVVGVNKVGGSCYVFAVRDVYGPTTAEVARTGQDAVQAPDDDGTLRKGVIWPNVRFVDNGDNTVTDVMTGLMWAKSANIGAAMTWSAALNAVQTRTDGNHSDWRLPNVKELETLLDISKSPGPCLPGDYAGKFLDVQAAYWTSTTLASNVNNAWYVNIGTGAIQTAAKTPTTYYVWPVRSTQ